MVTKGEQTRVRILDEAKRVFHRKGFSATSINDLLAAAGTTKGNLYFHFSGKEEVVLAVLRREQQKFMQFLDEALQGETPGARLDNFFRQALEKNRSRGFVGGCLFGNTALEASDTSEPFAEVVKEVFAAWIDKVAQTIAAAQLARQVRTDLPPLELAEMIVMTLEGGIMQARLHKSELPLKRSLDSLRKILELNLSSEKGE